MLNWLRQITERDRLAARVLELEDEVTSLKKQLSTRALSGPSFHEVKRSFVLDEDLRKTVLQRALDELTPVVEPHLMKSLKQIANGVQPSYIPSPQTYISGMNMTDAAVEVILPEYRRVIHVLGAFR